MRHRYPPSIRDRQTGSSLVEVLVAALVLGIGLIGLAMSQARSLDGLRQDSQQLQARLLAAGLIEQWRAGGPGAPLAAPVAAWRERVGERLPAGTARIEWPSAGTAAGRVALVWADRSADREARLVLVFGP